MAEAKKATTKKKTKVEEVETPVEAVVEAVVEETPAEKPAEKATTKAGKRSAKAVKEAEEKQAKEERKAEVKEAEAEKPAKAKPAPKTRSILERRGKKYRESAKLVDSTKEYTLKEALALAVKTSGTKFDATVELHVRLSVDPRHADQNIRENLVLPAGTGNNVRVAVFAEGDEAAKAKKAGAEIVGVEEIITKLDKEDFDFDVLIATPALMVKLGKYARVLGPKGMMPNPKSGTVTTDPAKATAEAKAGRVEYRVDSTGIVHMGIGKVSFGEAKLQENAQAVMSSIKGAKPTSVKSNYLKSAFVTTTMGPSIRLLGSDIF